MISKVLGAFGLGPKDDTMKEKEDVTDVDELKKTTGDDVEEDDLPEEELDKLLIADLMARGKISVGQVKSLENDEDTDKTVGGYKKPANWAYMDEDEKLEWVVEQNAAANKKLIEDAVSATESRILSRMAPMSRENTIKEIEADCDPEIAPYVKKALEETEKLFGGNKQVTNLSPKERKLIAEKAELIYLRSKSSGAPDVVDGEDVPTSGANKDVIAYMRKYNAARPTKPINYEQAKVRRARSLEDTAEGVY